MSQTSYDLNSAAAFAGMKADSRFDLVESMLAEQIVNFGRAVAQNKANNLAVSMPVKDRCILYFDADFVTSNVITITVNGVAAAAVTFTTDHATTIGLVAAAVAALTGVACTGEDNTVEGGSIFTIETAGVTITVSETVTAGASQATGYPEYAISTLFWLDADLVTSNTIDAVIAYANGTIDNMAQVTFATSHSNTVDLVEAALAAMPGIASAAAVDTAKHIIRVVPAEQFDNIIDIANSSMTVAAGASQAGVTLRTLEAWNELFEGIAIHTHKAPSSLAQAGVNDAKYNVNDAVNVLHQGAAWVETSKAVNSGSKGYVDMSGGIGKFTDAAAGNLPTYGRFKTNVAAAGLAILEINLP
jgi:hypothetical protein